MTLGPTSFYWNALKLFHVIFLPFHQVTDFKQIFAVPFDATPQQEGFQHGGDPCLVHGESLYNLKDALLLNSLFFSVFVRDPLRSLYSHPSPMTISAVHNIIPWEKKPSQLLLLLFRFEKEAFSIHLCDLSVDDETIFYVLQSSFQLTICFHNTWYTSKFTMLHIFIFIFTLLLPNFQILWNLKMLLYS